MPRVCALFALVLLSIPACHTEQTYVIRTVVPVQVRDNPPPPPVLAPAAEAVAPAQEVPSYYIGPTPVFVPLPRQEAAQAPVATKRRKLSPCAENPADCFAPASQQGSREPAPAPVNWPGTGFMGFIVLIAGGLFTVMSKLS